MPLVILNSVSGLLIYTAFQEMLLPLKNKIIRVAVRRHPLLLARSLFLAAMQEKRLFVLLGAV